MGRSAFLWSEEIPASRLNRIGCFMYLQRFATTKKNDWRSVQNRASPLSNHSRSAPSFTPNSPTSNPHRRRRQSSRHPRCPLSQVGSHPPRTDPAIPASFPPYPLLSASCPATNLEQRPHGNGINIELGYFTFIIGCTT
ncbi:hypothetical protein ACQJBY_020076 [Aegilops geniculata]